MKVIIKNLKKVVFETNINDDSLTILQLKEEIQKQHGFESNNLKLLKDGIILDNSKTLKDYNIIEDSIITMMITKAKISNKDKKEITSENNTNNENETTNNNNEDKKNEMEEKNLEEIKKKPKKKDYSNQINQLTEMGFLKSEVEIAIRASKGNIDKAIDYLYKGVKNLPIKDESDEEEEEKKEIDLKILDNKTDIEIAASVVKILVHSKKYTINQVLNLIQRNDSDLYKRIKDKEKYFIELLNNPISEEDTNIYYAYSKKTGWDNFQKKNTKSNKIKLTKNEYEAVKRLKNLANVSDYQAYEAYIICDRNENLAADYLLENIIGGGNNNNNRESNFVVEEKKDENQKKNENEKK